VLPACTERDIVDLQAKIQKRRYNNFGRKENKVFLMNQIRMCAGGRKLKTGKPNTEKELNIYG
jgi:hypothetical protein